MSITSSVPYLVQVYECLSDHVVPSLFYLNLLHFIGDCSVWKQEIDGEEFAIVPVLFINRFDNKMYG